MRPAQAYKAFYAVLFRDDPDLRPWHSDWLSGSILYGPRRRHLASACGRTLDVGCGAKLYEQWASQATRYVGIDVAPGPKVDLVDRRKRGGPCPIRASTSYSARRCWSMYPTSSTCSQRWCGCRGRAAASSCPCRSTSTSTIHLLTPAGFTRRGVVQFLELRLEQVEVET
jgi:hypothetical protein